MTEQLEMLIKARANLIEMVSYEDKRIQGFVNQVAKNLKMTWYVWNEVNGLSRFDSRSKRFEKEEDISDYLDILNFFTDNLEDNAILVLQDFHHILQRESSPGTTSRWTSSRGSRTARSPCWTTTSPARTLPTRAPCPT